MSTAEGTTVEAPTLSASAVMLFRELDFGPDDAKGDERLSEYFLRIPEYSRVVSGQGLFVIGRKGTGKTAICQMIYDESQRNPAAFCSMLSLKNNPSADLFASSDPGFRAPNEYISIWKFLIALEASKLALKDQSIAEADRQALRRFLDSNFGNTDVASLDAVSMLRKREWKVGIDTAAIPILQVPSASAGGASTAGSTQRLHFGRAATTLLEQLGSLTSDNTFYLLFDELDEDYRNDDRYYHLIISLFKAAYQVRKEQRSGLRIRPIVVLREDIFARLDDHDLNKFDDHVVRLRWAKTSGPFSLKGLVNQRIRVSVDGGQAIQDPWSKVVNEASWTGKPRTAWEFLAGRTMDRPRDIIKSLKCCQKYEGGERLQKRAILNSRQDYSQWLYNEVGNEIFRVIPEYRAALAVLSQIGRESFSLQDWRSEFGKEVALRDKYKPEEVLETLFRFSVVGYHKRGLGIFAHSSPHASFDPGAAKLFVHRGLQYQLVIRRD